MCFSVAAMASRCTMLGVRLLLHGFFSFLRDSRPPPRALSALAPAESRPKYLSRAIDLVAPCARATGEAGLRRIDPMDQVEQAHVDPKRFDYDSDCGHNPESWPDNPRPDDYRVRDVCGAGAVVTFPRIGPVDAERKEPQFARSMMSSCGESPRGILKSLKKKVSEALEPAALESLPRLVGALPGSYYLHDIIDEIDEAHYQRELKQFKKYSPDKDPDPEEEEYWRHETKHSIS